MRSAPIRLLDSRPLASRFLRRVASTWKSCQIPNVNATLEIPDELFQQAAAKAARENREVKDLVSEGLRLVLNRPGLAAEERRQRMQRAPVQIREGNVLPVLSNDDMATLLELSGERLP